jgi:hypothetical protein
MSYFRVSYRLSPSVPFNRIVKLKVSPLWTRVSFAMPHGRMLTAPSVRDTCR